MLIFSDSVCNFSIGIIDIISISLLIFKEKENQYEKNTD